MKLSIDRVFRRCFSWPQWLAAAEIGLVSLVIGIMTGWTSPYMARLTRPDSELPMTATEASWVASFINVGRMFGAVFGGLAQILVSSKKVVLGSGVPTALGWVCMLFANSVTWIYVARFSCGVGMGVFIASCPLFIGEISKPKIRGSLIGLIMMFMPVGNLVGNVMGTYVPLWLFASVSLVPNILYLVMFALLPPSPHHLTRKKKFEEAERALLWYQRNTVDTKTEIELLNLFVRMEESRTKMDNVRELMEPKNRKALFIVNAIFCFMQLSGLHSIYFYMEIILTNAMVTAVNPATLVYVVAGIGIIGGYLALRAIDKYGRRLLLALSSLGVALSMALFSAHYALLRRNLFDAQSLQWLSIMGAVSFPVSVCIGINQIPSTMLGELFPPNVKSLAACIASATSGLFAFISSKTYQPLTEVLNEEYVFAFYAILMMVQVIFCFCCVPETKGKTLQEIQEMLSRKKEPV